MVSKQFFNYVLANAEKTADVYDMWDLDTELDLDESLVEYIEIENAKFGSVYVEMEEFYRLLGIWLNMLEKKKELYNY